jgi:hypothetical protein
MEGGALSGLRFHPDPPAVSFDSALTDGEPYPRAGNLPAVEPLECRENLLVILGIDSNAVVRYGKLQLVPLFYKRDANLWHLFPPVFNRV